MTEAELVKAKARKKQLKAALTRHGKVIIDAAAVYDAERTIDVDLIIVIEEFKSVYAQLQTIYDRLFEHVAEEDETTFESLTKDQEAAFQQYLKVIQHAKILSPPSTASSSKHQPLSHAPPVPVKLPQLDLPKFGGAVDEWFHFKDLFESLINENSSLSDVQRFQYLKASLFADAAETISELPTTAINYNAAWALLKTRYEDKGRIVHTHLNQLFSLPDVTTDDANSLMTHVNQFNKHIRALEQLDELNTDTILIYLSTSKLDGATKEKWAEYCQEMRKKKENLTTSNLIDFLTSRSNILRSKVSIGSKSSFSSNKSHAKQTDTSWRKSVNTSQSQFPSNSNISCFICKGQHRVYVCQQFSNAALERRWQLVRENRMCSNCLGKGHTRDTCSSTRRCFKCNVNHHTLLHNYNKASFMQQDETSVAATPPTTSNTTSPTPSIEPSIPTTSAATSEDPKGTALTNARTKGFVIMPTAVIDICDNSGTFHSCRALIDSASDVNIMTDALAEKLKLPRQQQAFHLEGLSSSKTNVSAEVTTTFRSQHQSYSRQLNFVVLSKITSAKPAVSVNLDCFQIPPNIDLADPYFNESSAIDVLLSAEIVHELNDNGVIQLSNFGASAVNTKLGWTVSGKCAAVTRDHNVLHVSNNQSVNLINRKWEIETVPYNLNPRESTHAVASPNRSGNEVPFLKNGVFRVGARAQPAVSMSPKFPIILPSRNCLHCQVNSTPQQCIMGSLPATRVSAKIGS